MRILGRFIAFIILAFIFTVPANAQIDNVAANFRVSANRDLARDNPTLGASLSAAKNFSFVTLTAEVSGDKFDTGSISGREVSGNLEGRFHGGWPLFGSAGLRATNINIAGFNNTEYQPTIGAGFNYEDKLIAQGVYAFKGTGNQTSVGYNLEAYQRISRKIFVRGKHSLERVFINGNGIGWNSNLSVGVGYAF